MNIMNLIYMAAGGVSFSLIMSVVYLFTSHSAIVEIKDEIKDLHHYVKNMNKVQDISDGIVKKNKHGK